ncbi:MAG: hypothetical protein HOV68_18520 [Streptomycetaceae bacterium]|nr:hypothetical protein [Streptomycetaceae bacterium]
MGEFVAAVLSFPAMVFTFALVVVTAFWLCVLIGAIDHDAFEHGGSSDAFGLGGVPLTIAVSLLVSLAWALSVVGGVLLGRTDLSSAAHAALATGVLLLAVASAWTVTRVLVRPLRHLFPDEPGPSRHDFVGLTCVIRTGWVDLGFGQAEVTARDGTSALVQVRQTGMDELGSGSTGLLYAYDDAGEFFWVAPFDAALDPNSPSI